MIKEAVSSAGKSVNWLLIKADASSCGLVKSQKAFYDPLKDFMTLNRVMRRSIEGRTDGLNEIYADKDYRTIEVLAIYQ